MRKEGYTGVIGLKDDDDSIVSAVLKLIYDGAIRILKGNPNVRIKIQPMTVTILPVTSVRTI